MKFMSQWRTILLLEIHVAHSYPSFNYTRFVSDEILFSSDPTPPIFAFFVILSCCCLIEKTMVSWTIIDFDLIV